MPTLISWLIFVRKYLLATIFFVFSAALIKTALAEDLSTPESALLTLEDAYRAKDVELAVRTHDFIAEAKYILKKTLKDFAEDPKIVGMTAEDLQLSFRLEIKQEGFPDFNGAKCHVVGKETRSDRSVAMTEQCTFSNAETSNQVIVAGKTSDGWHIVTVE